MKKYALLFVSLFLSGCFSSTPDSRFYLLGNPRPAEVVSTKKINIAVQDVIVPSYLDRPQIVLQQQDSPELKISEFDRWASDLNTMLQNLLIDDLQSALPNAIVKPLSYGSTPRYIVKLNIEKFSGWLRDKAYFKGSWQILNAKGRILYEQEINLSHKIGKTYGNYVEAQSQMLNEVANMVAKKIISL